MQILKLMTLSMLTLAVGMAADDHPITISSGSPLTLQHDNWDPQDDQTLGTLLHDHGVTLVEVTSHGVKVSSVKFAGERLKLDVTYRDIGVTVTTRQNNQDIVVKLDSKTFFSKHFRRKDANTFESLPPDDSITAVAISKGGAAQPVGPISGPTKITIHYEGPQ